MFKNSLFFLVDLVDSERSRYDWTCSSKNSIIHKRRTKKLTLKDAWLFVDSYASKNVQWFLLKMTGISSFKIVSSWISFSTSYFSLFPLFITPNPCIYMRNQQWINKSTLSKNKIWISLFFFLMVPLNLSSIVYTPHLLVIPLLLASISHILINLPFFLQNNTNNQFYYLFRKEIFIKSSKQI